jgi:chorismate dehydratase
MIRISLVEYINTLPYKLSLEKSEFIRKNAVMSRSHPAGCVEDLRRSRADIGLIPVGALSSLPGFKIIEGYGLASKKQVDSVLLFSEVPLEEITHIYLDYQSKSSNGFIKILAKKFWQKDFIYLDSQPDYESKIKVNFAGLVIGDRALKMKNSFRYVYDLAEEWYKFTRLPSVYAVWVSNGKADEQFIAEFVKILSSGVENRIENCKPFASEYSYFDLEDYIGDKIEYRIGVEEVNSIDLYQNLLDEIQNK